MTSKCPEWLNTAIFYEIYPQSFLDANGDGIGDLPGIIKKLDYIKYLGCNAVWINPCFASPFGDAGYDVSDYYSVAPRYGTNDDMKRLVDEAKKRGIRICLDLVPGHTSIDHPWFEESCKEERNRYSNWYIWTNSVWEKPEGGLEFIRGYSERDAGFMTNFFYMQPALNYGFANPDPNCPWQLPVDHPDVLAVRNEIKNIMRFWLDLGVSGFRVDMAMSLVKNDPDKKETVRFWREVREMFDKNYPDAALISEWFEPTEAIPAGFHADFLMWDSNSTLFRDEFRSMYVMGSENRCSFFRKEGKGDIRRFLDDYLERYRATKGKGYISIVSGNHDIPRIGAGRDADDLAVAFAFILTMPGIPFIYYGDEIGMDYVRGLPSKEGGYHRTGTRTPMQWSSDGNAGFSSAPASELYLPVADSPNVEEQIGKPGSLLETVRSLAEVRGANPALCADGSFETVYAEAGKSPFVFLRTHDDQRILVAVNPSAERVTVDINAISEKTPSELLIGRGTSLTSRPGGLAVRMDGVSYGIFKLA